MLGKSGLGRFFLWNIICTLRCVKLKSDSYGNEKHKDICIRHECYSS